MSVLANQDLAGKIQNVYNNLFDDYNVIDDINNT